MGTTASKHNLAQLLEGAEWSCEQKLGSSWSRAMWTISLSSATSDETAWVGRVIIETIPSLIKRFIEPLLKSGDLIAKIRRLRRREELIDEFGYKIVPSLNGSRGFIFLAISGCSLDRRWKSIVSALLYGRDLPEWGISIRRGSDITMVVLLVEEDAAHGTEIRRSKGILLSWVVFAVCVQYFPSNPSLPLALQHSQPSMGCGFLCIINWEGYRGNGEVGNELGDVLGVVVWPRNHGRGWYCFGAKGYRDWAFKVFTVILLGFPGPSDGLRLHPIVFFSSGSGLTADSSVLTLTLAFLDFGLDSAQSFPFHAHHKGYRNAIELPEGAKVSLLRSDTIRLVQNGCAFNGLMSEDPIQHLKDFIKIVDSIDLNCAIRNTTRLRLFCFTLCDQAITWLDRLPARSISTRDDLTTRFLPQFFPPERTAKLQNDILMRESFQGLTSKSPSSMF
ncbi:zinc finger, CCHC-type containing protein [Tanacetum coccineum]